MTATTDRITELLINAGANYVQIGWDTGLRIPCVLFFWEGHSRIKYGTTAADLLTRIEHWLRNGKA